jgi:hypothetical protein
MEPPPDDPRRLQGLIEGLLLKIQIKARPQTWRIGETSIIPLFNRLIPSQ